MTLHLILTRHAKSDWDDDTLDDHSRPLSERGQRDATSMGKWLATQNHVPDKVISSDAVRTKQTIEAMLPSLPAAIETTFMEELYLASPGQLLWAISKQPPSTLMVVAHNPGIGSLAAGLLRARPDASAFIKYPTCATTVMSFPIESWNEISAASGKLIAFQTPKLLEADRQD